MLFLVFAIGMAGRAEIGGPFEGLIGPGRVEVAMSKLAAQRLAMWVNSRVSDVVASLWYTCCCMFVNDAR